MSGSLVVRGGCSSLEPTPVGGTVVPGLANYVRHTRRVQFPAALGAAVRELVGAAPGARSPSMQLGDALFDEARRAMALGRHDWDDLMTYFAYASPRQNPFAPRARACAARWAALGRCG